MKYKNKYHIYPIFGLEIWEASEGFLFLSKKQAIIQYVFDKMQTSAAPPCAGASFKKPVYPQVLSP